MGIGSNLASGLKTKKSKGLLITVAAVGGVAAFVVFSNQPSTPVSPSLINSAPAVDTIQGLRPVSPAMGEALDKDDLNRANAASQTGSSAIPTIRMNDTNEVTLATPLGTVDPPNPRRPEPVITTRPVVSAATIPVAPVVVPTQQVQSSQQQPPPAVGVVPPTVWAPAAVTFHADMNLFAPKAPVSQVPAQVPAADSVSSSGFDLPIAGTVLYAEMISEANSDSPGPVLAQIVQGPLTGAKLIGSFETRRDSLVINFHTISLDRDRNGKEIGQTASISAFAVDTKTISPGVATSVDYHVIQNVGITFATAFAQGFGQAISQSGQQVVSNSSGTTIVNPALTAEEQLYVAGGNAASAAGQTLNQLFGNRPTTVKVKAGTGIGVFFLSSGR